MVHYTFKKFLKSAEKYMIMKDNMINKKYISRKSKKKMHNFRFLKLWFSKNVSVNINKNSRHFQTRHLRLSIQSDTIVIKLMMILNLFDWYKQLNKIFNPPFREVNKNKKYTSKPWCSELPLNERWRELNAWPNQLRLF